MDDVDRILEQWRQARPDLDVGAMGPLGRLSRVFHHFSRSMGETFARHGLNAAGFDVLATLRRSPPPHALSPGALMASMMITSGTMTNRIEQLAKAGLVTRTSDSADARRAVVKLTPKGFDLIDKAIADHVQTQAALLSGLSDQEIARFDTLLRALLKTTGEGD
ncbi:MarR family transcriptional regulator (plasmid) [Ponticoccus alexandrii]|uniref:MarR family transcriptional regulator n=1 Tax=Ponticoccus alexandrii TaxID=1943633 RepID=A0ABX7FJ66_9RHOB|nr:MarR family transcriptional regulator [Ponticoccus alexandrii]ETA49491.2 transcriptional regulator [Rhodobacteraceae bacterium PD-2]QRF69372.1 MarR family transcriptional regulator [Ponticoccus alexandrii]